MAAVRGERGATSVVGMLLLIAVVVIAGMMVTVLAMTMLPQSAPSTSYTASFGFDRSNGSLQVTGNYVEDPSRYHLAINGREVYEWGSIESQRLACLNEGDRVSIVSSEPDSEDTYLLRKHTVEAPTRCSLSGGASRFAFATVGHRQMPLQDDTYEFTLAIDPDGPTDQVGDQDFPTTNPWVYIQRYERSIENLSPPVYVVVFPDNVHWNYQWDNQPPASVRDSMPTAYSIDNSGNVNVNATGGNEPTNDVYMVFKPGCSASKFKFISMAGGYNNQILFDGTEMFRTDTTSTGTVYTRRGVDCVD
jgi:flagellin-like protein